jgi:hypothetical protein
MKYISGIFLTTILLLSTCKKATKDPVPELLSAPTTVVYTADGRSVKASDINPIALDINADGSIDFTVFVQLMANSEGDHLYAGINPIGTNLIKSGPADDEHFQNMGFLVVELKNTLINSTLSSNQQWTMDHSTLAIRHTKMDNTIWYEGGWNDGLQQLVAIQHCDEGKFYFGWLRLQFNRSNETVTLIDYAYNTTEGDYIIAGYH